MNLFNFLVDALRATIDAASNIAYQTYLDNTLPYIDLDSPASTVSDEIRETVYSVLFSVGNSTNPSGPMPGQAQVITKNNYPTCEEAVEDNSRNYLTNALRWKDLKLFCRHPPMAMEDCHNLTLTKTHYGFFFEEGIPHKTVGDDAIVIPTQGVNSTVIACAEKLAAYYLEAWNKDRESQYATGAGVITLLMAALAITGAAVYIYCNAKYKRTTDSLHDPLLTTNDEKSQYIDASETVARRLQNRNRTESPTTPLSDASFFNRQNSGDTAPGREQRSLELETHKTKDFVQDTRRDPHL